MELSDFKLGPAAYIVLAARDTAPPAFSKIRLSAFRSHSVHLMPTSPAQ